MKKAIYIGAVLLAFASAGAATRSNKAQVVIREQENGNWQMFVFGPVCESGHLQATAPADSTQPIEIKCSK
jgi:hypothetical protein